MISGVGNKRPSGCPETSGLWMPETGLPVGADNKSFFLEPFDDKIVLVVFAAPAMCQLIDAYGRCTVLPRDIPIYFSVTGDKVKFNP